MIRSAHASDERVYRQDTLDAYERGVRRAIGEMRERLGETLTMDELASGAFMSRYHFTRTFAQITGVSPGRFLTSLRLQEAKRLLLKTDRSVTDISLDVGYNSLGTFTRIFTDFVGFSPLRFRQLSMPLLQFHIDDVVKWIPNPKQFHEHAALQGTLVSNERFALVTVGLFRTAIPRSHPLECICLAPSMRFAFRQQLLSSGRIFAVGLMQRASMEDAILVSRNNVYVGTRRVLPHANDDRIVLVLRPQQLIDPPVVVAFPLLIAYSLLGGVAAIGRGNCQTSNLGEASIFLQS